MAQQKGRRIAHFAAGGYAGPGAITATAQGLPSATPAGGYTPGAETNAAGSWGAGAQSGGVAGDTNVSPVGAPDTSAFTQPGNYVAPAAALPAAAANTAMAPTPAPTSGPTAMQASMPGGYGTPSTSGGGFWQEAEGGAIPERMKDGGTVQNMKRGGKVRQMKPNGKPGSSQPANTPPQGRPATPPKPTPPDPDDPTQGGPYANPMGGDTPQPAGQGFRAMPSAISAGPAPSPGFRRGGHVSGGGMSQSPTGFDTQAYLDNKQPIGGQPGTSPTNISSYIGGTKSVSGLAGGGAVASAFDEGGAAPDPGDAGGGDQSQQSGGPSPAVQSALTAARSQFGLNDNMFNMMSQGLSSQTADNQETPRPIQPAPNGGPKKPFNPRDFVPGGSKASDSGQTDTASAAGGGAIPEVWSTKVPQMGQRKKKPS